MINIVLLENKQRTLAYLIANKKESNFNWPLKNIPTPQHSLLYTRFIQ